MPLGSIVLSTTSKGIDSSVVHSKIFSDYLKIQSILKQPLLDNMKDVFNIIRSELLAGMENFRAPTSCHAYLVFTLFCEGSPSWQKSFPLGLALFLNILAKCSKANEENFSAFILPWYCSAAITLSMYNCCHKVSNILSCAFMTSFCSQTEIKPLSRFSPGHSSWSSGLVQRVHFMSKTCSIEIEYYTLPPKVCRKFMTNFLGKLKPQFLSFLSLFQASLSQNSMNCLLANGRWNVCFYHYSFYTDVSHLYLQALGFS